jgi:beta-N-acetylhexosaminidase
MDPNQLTTEQLAGQRLMVGFEGTRLSDRLKYYIDTLKVGGIILFRQNVVPPAQLGELCTAAQEHARKSGQPPLIIAIDQEGGHVARLKAPDYTEFPGNPNLKTVEDARRFARITARELQSVGIKMNMAPVLDVADRNVESVMAGRAFGDNIERVARMGMEVIDHLQQRNIMAVAKHFPGIGRTTLDSHRDKPILRTPGAELEATDMSPFKTAIRQDVAGIMLSHIVYQDIDPQWPASLSPRIANELLRRRLGYDGLVLTDDMDMGAITNHFGITTATRQVLAADVDMMLICHEGPNIERAYKEIVNQFSCDRDLRERGITCAGRILNLKLDYLG